jgi:hypothetical protein
MFQVDHRFIDLSTCRFLASRAFNAVLITTAVYTPAGLGFWACIKAIILAAIYSIFCFANHRAFIGLFTCFFTRLWAAYGFWGVAWAFCLSCTCQTEKAESNCKKYFFHF